LKKETVILCSLLLLKIVIQFFLISGEYDLHRDEFLHLDQAKHLAWGYASVPPFTSWNSWLILQLGNGVFWVRFFPALYGALTLLLVWQIVVLLKVSLLSKLLASSAFIFSSLLRTNILYQPNSFDVFSWTLVFFLVINYIQTYDKKWLYYMAFAFAIGFLNKYNIFFLLLGLLPSLLFTEHRKIFTKKDFYWSIGLALLLISPNLIWQFQNDFPVFKHLNQLAELQLVNVNRKDFIKEQIQFFFGGLPVLIAAFWGFIRFPKFKSYRVLFYTFWICLSLFIYFKAKAYYTLGLYPVLLPFGAVYLSEKLKNGWKKYLAYLLILLPFLVMFTVRKAVFPILSPTEIKADAEFYKKLNLTRWEDGKDHDLPQDFADMLGWKELAAKVDSAFESIPDKEHLLVYASNYGQAGAINYYSKHKEMAALSMNADYINWFPKDKTYINVIRIKDAGQDFETEKAYFEEVIVIGEIENEFAIEEGTSIAILKNAKIDINAIIERDRAER